MAAARPGPASADAKPLSCGAVSGASSLSSSVRSSRLSLRPDATPSSPHVAGSAARPPSSATVILGRSRAVSTMPLSSSSPPSAAPANRVQVPQSRRTSLQVTPSAKAANSRHSFPFPHGQDPSSTPSPIQAQRRGSKVNGGATGTPGSPRIVVSPGIEEKTRSRSGSGDLITETAGLDEIDEEMQNALDGVARAHTTALASLKRVLSASDAGSAMSLHLLHTEVKLLTEKAASDRKEIERLRRANASLNMQVGPGSSAATSNGRTPNSPAVPRASLVDVLSSENDQSIRAFFRTLPSTNRMHLLHLLLEAALPGDIAALKRYLSQVEKDKYDIIAELPGVLVAKCLLHLDVYSILRCRLVSKRWDKHITDNAETLWRTLCLRLTSNDDDPPVPADGDWYSLYQGLHHRERNFQHGLAQSVISLTGHTASISAMRLRGSTLVTGSLDGTIRIWDLRKAACIKSITTPAPVSSLDFDPEAGVIAAGGNDVGRVFLLSKAGALLATLSGHNKGIRTLAMNSDYLVSAGFDKALVCWDWRKATRIVKFGQQTNPCAAISLFGHVFSAVDVHGSIRCFNIRSRGLISQHKVQVDSVRQPNVIGGDIFQWFIAEHEKVILSTKTMMYQLEYLTSSEGEVDLTSPPQLISATPITYELHTGTLDVLKRRFAAAPRFANRLGEEMRIFVGHLPATSDPDDPDDGSLKPIEGAWLDSEDGVAVAARNPSCMALGSDSVIVGCSDGHLYSIDFCGTKYRLRQPILSPAPTSDAGAAE